MNYVKWLQETLRALGYEPGPSDGLPGEITAVAVSAFQRDRDLTVDGIVGERTNTALLLALNERICLPLPAADPISNDLDLKDFAPDEFACPCGCGLDVADALKSFAQSLRNAFGWPLVITSGGRCPTVNRDAGGVPDSCHLTGEAFDCYFPGHMNEAVMAAMADFAVGQGTGVIRYPQQLFCHFQLAPRNDFMN